MCVALSSPDDFSTTVAVAKYSVEEPRTELQAEVCMTNSCGYLESFHVHILCCTYMYLQLHTHIYMH